MRRVITAQDIPASGEMRVPVGSIITASAREMAAARGVRIVELPEEELSALAPPARTIAIGADHGGFRLKEVLKPVIASLGLEERRLRPGRERDDVPVRGEPREHVERLPPDGAAGPEQRDAARPIRGRRERHLACP